MAKAFEFADFVQEFWVDFRIHQKVTGHYKDNGQWVPGGEVSRDIGGIVLPLNNDELRREGNGTYTAKDRKVYTLERLKEGDKVDFNGQSYTIDAYKDYEAYADVFIYFAKGVGK
jgi:hypothetical protein